MGVQLSARPKCLGSLRSLRPVAGPCSLICLTLDTPGRPPPSQLSYYQPRSQIALTPLSIYTTLQSPEIFRIFSCKEAALEATFGDVSDTQQTRPPSSLTTLLLSV